MTREDALIILQNCLDYENGEKSIYPMIPIEIYRKVLKTAVEALKERPHENWEYLKEHITEMRDADGKLNQKQTCQFILNLMGVIEKEGEVE